MTGERIAFFAGKAFGIVARVLPGLIRDGVGISGAIGVAYGAHMIYPAAGFIVAGVLALGGALLHATMESHRQRLTRRVSE